MKLLAIDTSTDYLSLAIAEDEKILCRFHKRSAMRHSSLLIPTIEGLLKSAGLKLKEIGCFCISIGPGSFTGLRIGVATVKGFAYCLKKPIVAVPTLDVIAYNAEGFKGLVCPVLDARKGKVYSCIYRSDGETVKRVSKYLLLPADELVKKNAKYDNVLYLGDGIDFIERSFERSYPSRSQDQILFSKIWYPRADVVARLAVEYIKTRKFVKPEDLEPMYLYSRECDITGK